MSVQTHRGARTYDPITISPLSFWAATVEEREQSFRILRDERPLSWHAPIEGSLMEPEIDGVWAVTRHEDIAYVSKNPQLFCSGQGVMIRQASPAVHSELCLFLAEHVHHGDLGWFLDALGFSSLNRAQRAVVEAGSGER